MVAEPAVLVTRPEREAGPWVQALQAEGVQAEAFPQAHFHHDAGTLPQDAPMLLVPATD